ncbi:hypothetical protein FEP89_05287 [Burkholderia multivorans]|nr:hypothetical protein [Burkholderia multivorans]
MAERDLPDRAGDEREAQREQAVQPRVGQRLQDIRRCAEPGRHGRERDQRDDRRARHAQRLRGCEEGARHRLGRQRAVRAEQAVRPPDEEHDQQPEREQVAIARAEQRDAVAFDEPEQQAPRDRARHVAEAADQQRDDALQRRLEAHRRIDAVVVHADQQPAHAAERTCDRKHRLIHAVDVDAHLQRRVAILRRRAHGPAEPREAQEAVQQCGRRDTDAGDQQIERPERGAAEPQMPVGQRRRHRARIRAECELRELVEDEADADRREQRRDARRMTQRPQPDRFDRDAERAAA